MQYRSFGKLGFNVSALGFGAMRFPCKDGKIDEEESTRIIHFAIDQGVNYIDTAYPYHDGNSEVFLGKALQNGYREKVKLTTKMPTWLIEKATDFDKYLDEQLQRLQVDYLDFYLLHTLNRDWWNKIRDLGVIKWAERQIAAGRFRYLGFSFHDNLEVFRSIIDDYDQWAMCQIQYNFMDVNNQAGRDGLHYAASKGIPVVIMEPLLGGKLTNPPQPIQGIWDSAATKRSPVEWALQWLWDQPEVTTVLSGMSSIEQVADNVALASKSENHLSAADQELIIKVAEKYRQMIAIPCSSCRYCMPCPRKVDIPANFGIYNDIVSYDKLEGSRGQYEWWKTAFDQGINENDIRAVNCVQCGACEAKCPQSIPISRWLPVIHQVLGEGRSTVINLEEE